MNKRGLEEELLLRAFTKGDQLVDNFSDSIRLVAMGLRGDLSSPDLAYSKSLATSRVLLLVLASFSGICMH